MAPARGALVAETSLQHPHFTQHHAPPSPHTNLRSRLTGGRWRDSSALPRQCVGPFPYPCGGPYEIPDDGSWVLAHLWTYNLFTDDPSKCNNDSHYYGMVHPSETSWYGLGYRPGDEALGVMHVDPGVLGGTAPDWFVPGGSRSS